MLLWKGRQADFDVNPFYKGTIIGKPPMIRKETLYQTSNEMRDNLALLAKGFQNLPSLSFRVSNVSFIESKCVTNQHIGL